MLREFRVTAEQLGELKVGGTIGVDIFKVGQKVDVAGTTIGKGFAGVIKRHHFSSNRASHGNSRIAQQARLDRHGAGPGPRVSRASTCPAIWATSKRTIQNLVIVRIDAERQLLLIRGAVPGAKNGDVTVYPAVKTSRTVRSRLPSPRRRQVNNGTQMIDQQRQVERQRGDAPRPCSGATTTRRWSTRS